MKPYNVVRSKAVSFIIGLFSFCLLTNAQPGPTPDTYIQYLGVQDGIVVFEISGEALPPRSILRITDGERNELLQERIRNSSLRKRYKLLPEEVQKIQFEILHKSVVVNRKTFDLRRYTEERIIVTAGR